MGFMVYGWRWQAWTQLFFIFAATPAAHVSSQARGWIRAAAEAYTMAMAIPDLSRIFDLCCSLRQWQILNPVSKARGQTCILMSSQTLRWVLKFLTMSPFDFFFFFFFFFFGCHQGIWKFLGQGLNPSQSFDLGHSCSNIRYLTHCAGLGIKPVPPQRQAGSLTHCATVGTPIIWV